MTRQMFYQSESDEHAEMRTMAAMKVLHDVRGMAIHATTLPDPENRGLHYSAIELILAPLDEQQLHDVALHAIGVIAIFDAKAAGIPIADDYGWRPETADAVWPDTGPCSAGPSVCTRAEGHPGGHVL